MKINSKKVAYGFLIVCIILTGYLLYDTFKIATSDPVGSSTEENGAAQPEPGEVLVDFDDYEVEERTSVSLLRRVDNSQELYLFENEQVCEDGAFDVVNENLIAAVKFSGTQGEYIIENVSVFRRTIEGSSTQINSVPTVSFELDTEETESGGLKGDLKFVWEDRLLEGEFDAEVCDISAAVLQ